LAMTPEHYGATLHFLTAAQHATVYEPHRLPPSHPWTLSYFQSFATTSSAVVKTYVKVLCERLISEFLTV
jgi:hypothetical protein